MPVEFTCCECGYQILRADVDQAPAPPLCANCLHVPGWHMNPQLKHMLAGGAVELVDPDRPEQRKASSGDSAIDAVLADLRRVFGSLLGRSSA